MTDDTLTLSDEDNLLKLPAGVDGPIPSGVAVGALALNFALKYYDMRLVKDGVMYQQLKLEQKELGTFGLQDVFEIAKQIEVHLLATSDRVASLVVEALVDGVLREEPVADMVDIEEDAGGEEE